MSSSNASASVAILVVCLAMSVAAQDKATRLDLGRPVPESVMTASALPGPPEQFAHALALINVPAGVILTSQGTAARLEGNAPLGGHSLAEALEEFRRTHPRYWVDEAGDGILIAPELSRCLAPLDRTLDLETSGAYNVALDALAKAIDPSLPDIPPGMVNGRSSSRRPGDENAFRQVVTIRAKGATVRSILMDLSRQVRGIVWGVREQQSSEGSTECVLTLFAPNETLFTSYRLR